MPSTERLNPQNENIYGLNRRQFFSIVVGTNLGIVAASYCGEQQRQASIISKDLSTSDLDTWYIGNRKLLTVYPDLKSVNYLAQGGKPLHRDFFLTGIQRELTEKTTILPDLKIIPQYTSSLPHLAGYRVVIEQQRKPLSKIDDIHTLSGVATALDLASIAQEYTRAAMPWLGSLNQREALTKVIAQGEFCEFAKFAGRMRVGAILRANLEDQTKEGILLIQNPLVALGYKRYQRYAEERGLLFKDNEGIWRWPQDSMPRISWQGYRDFLEWRG